MNIAALFRRFPGGLTASEIAGRMGCSTRTIERDILVLQAENNLPLVDAPGRRYRLMPEHKLLGPVTLNLQEARAVLLAVRLFCRFADDFDPDGVSALEKIAEALSDPIGAQVQATADQLKQRPTDNEHVRVLRQLTEAWAAHATVIIQYRSPTSPLRRLRFDPYLLEPSALGSATYVIGFSHDHEAVRTFKVDRIDRVESTGEEFVPGDIESISRRMSQSGGVMFNDTDEAEDVALVFSTEVADRVAETIWHPSQQLSWRDDGSLLMELKLPNLVEFVSWVRSWGPQALVLRPESLRETVATTLRAAAERYE